MSMLSKVNRFQTDARDRKH